MGRLETGEVGVHPGGVVSYEPLRIYTGILGQIGDIVMFTPTARRIKELFPRSTLTFAVSEKYREAGELVVGLPYVDRLFVTQLYFEKLSPLLFQPWERGWPVDLLGDDEIQEQRRHQILFETRPRHRRERWWECAHQVEETAHMVGIPGPIDRRTEIAIPTGTVIPDGWKHRIVLHNDPAIDSTKAWSWDHVRELARLLAPETLVLLGNPGPDVPGAIDLRGKTNLAQAAAVIRDCRYYVGVDSGLMWIAGSLQVPTVGLYGTSYIPLPRSIQPENPRATYLETNGPATGILPGRVVAVLT